MSIKQRVKNFPDLNDRQYDVMKWVVQILLPALGALYFGLSQIWGFPKGEEVVGTLALLTVFLGALLNISAKRYNPAYDGEFVVTTDADGRKTFTLELGKQPEELESQGFARMNITTSPE